jgi:hypothetical protein
MIKGWSLLAAAIWTGFTQSAGGRSAETSKSSWNAKTPIDGDLKGLSSERVYHSVQDRTNKANSKEHVTQYYPLCPKLINKNHSSQLA